VRRRTRPVPSALQMPAATGSVRGIRRRRAAGLPGRRGRVRGLRQVLLRRGHHGGRAQHRAPALRGGAPRHDGGRRRPGQPRRQARRVPSLLPAPPLEGRSRRAPLRRLGRRVRGARHHVTVRRGRRDAHHGPRRRQRGRGRDGGQQFLVAVVGARRLRPPRRPLLARHGGRQGGWHRQRESRRRRAQDLRAPVAADRCQERVPGGGANRHQHGRRGEFRFRSGRQEQPASCREDGELAPRREERRLLQLLAEASQGGQRPGRLSRVQGRAHQAGGVAAGRRQRERPPDTVVRERDAVRRGRRDGHP